MICRGEILDDENTNCFKIAKILAPKSRGVADFPLFSGHAGSDWPRSSPAVHWRLQPGQDPAGAEVADTFEIFFNMRPLLLLLSPTSTISDSTLEEVSSGQRTPRRTGSSSGRRAGGTTRGSDSTATSMTPARRSLSSTQRG